MFLILIPYKYLLMSELKYIYDEKNKTLETLDGVLFIDNNSEIAKFNSVSHAYNHLEENKLFGSIGKRLNMQINNSI